ncbi:MULTISPECIES: 3TM-type holin [Alteromonadaceae]|uniref:3TM-type holin n=1 Tax=Alteromonadaceae TaxID=72275 RepID=UPI001C092CE0|nr:MULTISPECIES: 3TM-type holin [Aliiglaciecola]MBU2878581.1 holin family protein [Aliiglaciecola lipolytica]MDO6709590.1 3TM-type holin [Aliiglaciecola sp. 2_MG-2023]MDO6750868.1 3TM-type holin [Aliiglaciecola sp. 1_MG-2023]
MAIGIMEFIGGIFKPAADLIDNVHTSDEERLVLKKQLDEIRAGVQLKMIELEHKVLEYETKVLQAQQAVIVAEAQGKSWIQRNWRPVLMMVIIFIVANNYILFPYLNLFTDKVAMLELPEELFTLLTVGVGGYVVGRSGEKIAQSMRKQPSVENEGK